MFAVIKSGGKQFKVSKDSVIKVEKLEGEAGAKVEFSQVLMMGDATKASIIGTPLVKGAKVTGEILSQTRDPKIIVFKKKRRQNYRRKHGHRQDVTHVRIVGIDKN